MMTDCFRNMTWCFCCGFCIWVFVGTFKIYRAMCAPFVLFLLKMAHQLSTSASIGFEIVLTRCQHAIRSCETICNRLNDLTNLSSSNIFLEMKLSRWFLKIVIDLPILDVLVPCINVKRTKSLSRDFEVLREIDSHFVV